MRKGVTPVVAVMLLVVITVAAASSVYYVVDSVTGDKEDATSQQTGLTLVYVTCEAGSAPKLHMSLHNYGAEQAQPSNVTLTVKNSTATQRFETVIDGDFTEPGSSDTVTFSGTPSRSLELGFDSSYTVEVVGDHGLEDSQGCLTADGTTAAGTGSNSPPSSSDNYTLTGWQDSAQAVELQCNDPDGTCVTEEWILYDDIAQVDSGSGAPPRVVTVGESEDGAYELRYRGKDDENAIESWNLVEIKIDQNPPHTDVSSDGSWHEPSSFTVSVDDGGFVGAGTCSYRVNGSTGWSSWKSRTCGSVDITVGSGQECPVEGENVCGVNVKAEDTTGDTAQDTAYFNIDLSTPSTTILAPSNGTVVTGDFDVDVEDTDSPGRSCGVRTRNGSSPWSEWKTRNCDQNHTVKVGPAGSCSAPATCYVQVNITDGSGDTDRSTKRYSTGTGTGALTSPTLVTSIDWDMARNFTVDISDPAAATSCSYSVSGPGGSTSTRARGCNSLVEVPAGTPVCSTGDCTLTLYASNSTHTSSSNHVYTSNSSQAEVEIEKGDVFVSDDLENYWRINQIFHTSEFVRHGSGIRPDDRFNLSYTGAGDIDVWNWRMYRFGVGDQVLKLEVNGTGADNLRWTGSRRSRAWSTCSGERERSLTVLQVRRSPGSLIQETTTILYR